MPMKQQIPKMRAYLSLLLIAQDAQVLFKGKSATRAG